jgi:osmoprotectant transport system ATP-binding protein
MIQLKNLSKSFGKHSVIQDFSLEIKKGETQVLLGLSGSGKTTVLKLINGLLQADAGSILFENKTLQDQDILEARRRMGYVIQQSGLFPHYTVFQNIAVVPRLLKWSQEKTMVRAKTLLEKLNLQPQDYLNKYPSELSGGEAQRVSVARALAANPPVLLMDEPFGALDPITRVSIRKQFLELDELVEKTIVLVTHDVQEAFAMGDKIALMDQGKIVQNGSPQELLNKPTPFTQSFIGDEMLSLQLRAQGIYEPLNQKILNGELKANDLKIDQA